MKILSLSLIPWIHDLHPSNTLETRLYSSIVINSESLENIPQAELSLLDRLRVYGEGVRGSRFHFTLTKNRINSQRSYHSLVSLKTKLLSSSKKEKTPSMSSKTASFGQIISLSQPDSHTELMVCDDPYNPGRLLVGLFTESSFPDDNGFVWTKLDGSRLRDIFSSSVDDFEVRHQCILKTNAGFRLWEKESSESAWSYVGNVELVSGQGGRFTTLRGIRVVPDGPDETEDIVDRFPDDFDNRTRPLLEKLQRIIEQTQSVFVKLVKSDSLCEIDFIDQDDNEVIYKEVVQGTCDVISLLRYTTTISHALRTSSGHLVTWSPFADIEYGRFENIRPFVETTASKDIGKSIDSAFSDICESTDVSINLILKHDSKNCPIVISNESRHGRCWQLSSEDDNALNNEILSSPLSGREVYGLLTTGKLRYKNQNYSIELGLGHNKDEPEFYSYNEDRWIRRLLKENDILLKPLAPGTFLQTLSESWSIQLNFSERTIEWVAISNVTGLPRTGMAITYTLNLTHNLQEVMQDFLESVSSHIDLTKISNFPYAKSLLKTQLRNRGYGNKSPKCQLDVSLEDETIHVTLVLKEGKYPHIIGRESFLVRDEIEKQAFLEALYYRLNEGDLSMFNINNTEKFLEKINELL